MKAKQTDGCAAPEAHLARRSASRATAKLVLMMVVGRSAQCRGMGAFSGHVSGHVYGVT